MTCSPPTKLMPDTRSTSVIWLPSFCVQYIESSKANSRAVQDAGVENQKFDVKAIVNNFYEKTFPFLLWMPFFSSTAACRLEGKIMLHQFSPHINTNSLKILLHGSVVSNFFSFTFISHRSPPTLLLSETLSDMWNNYSHLIEIPSWGGKEKIQQFVMCVVSFLFVQKLHNPSHGWNGRDGWLLMKSPNEEEEEKVIHWS